MRITDRFLRYVKMDTQSDENTKTTPSTQKQRALAKLLAEELTQMGAQDVVYDETYGYVYATVPATPGHENAPVLGFIAHMDTSPAVSGADVRPRIIEQYDGKDILLNPAEHIVLSAAEFPEIVSLAGQDLIVTDGTTLLGADDKAGIAEIMTAAERLLQSPEIPHGKLRIGFTPDEEIGEGADHFDLKLFGADYAYTVDGGAFGELENETFNAAAGHVTVHGRNVHPGSAKGKMVNAILIAMEFQSMLPAFQNPMYTEGREGFFHLDSISGNVEKAEAEYIIRDHDRALFEEKKALFVSCGNFLNWKYGQGVAEVSVKDSYYNMKEKLEPHPHLIENAAEILRELGAEPQITPIRGGTDGARLSYLGLPCPNLCTGGANFHSRFEYVSIQAMEKVTQLLMELARRYGKDNDGRINESGSHQP